MAREPSSEHNLDGYDAPVIPWAKARDVFAGGMSQITQGPGSGGPGRHTSWLATVRRDGRPHVVPLGVRWTEDAAYFTAGPGTQKARNLATIRVARSRSRPSRSTSSSRARPPASPTTRSNGSVASVTVQRGSCARFRAFWVPGPAVK